MNVAWNQVVNLTIWGFTFLVLVVLHFGASKVTADRIFRTERFAKIGIGQWFRYFTGGLEIRFAILLLIPRASAMAGLTAAIHDVYAGLV